MAIAFSNFGFVSNSNTHKPIQPPSASRLSNTNPMIMTIQPLKNDYWASKEAQIEAHLKEAISVRFPIEVFEPMHNLVMAGPKTKAATLCVAACELVGGDNNSADTVACALALQLVYSAQCLHEKLPLTDRPSLNPNIKPMTHGHDYSPNIELLIGDGIIPFAFELLAQSANPAQNNSGRVLRVTAEISRAIGTLVCGQWEEVKIENSKGCDDALIERMLEKKEGGLHACGAACGAILGGGNEEEIERVRKFGLYLGIIQGIVHNVGLKNGNNKRFVKRVEQLKLLAMEELKHLKGRNIGPISSLVQANVDELLN